MPLMPAPPMPTKCTRPEVGVAQVGGHRRPLPRAADRTRSASASSASRSPRRPPRRSWPRSRAGSVSSGSTVERTYAGVEVGVVDEQAPPGVDDRAAR